MIISILFFVLYIFFSVPFVSFSRFFVSLVLSFVCFGFGFSVLIPLLYSIYLGFFSSTLNYTYIRFVNLRYAFFFVDSDHDWDPQGSVNV